MLSSVGTRLRLGEQLRTPCLGPENQPSRQCFGILQPSEMGDQGSLAKSQTPVQRRRGNPCRLLSAVFLSGRKPTQMGKGEPMAKITHANSLTSCHILALTKTVSDIPIQHFVNDSVVFSFSLP